MEGTGYRLSDSQAIEGNSPSKPTTNRRSTKQNQPQFSSQDDVATTLLSSLNNSKRGGNIGKFTNGNEKCHKFHKHLPCASAQC
jgi:hypothetical protein